VELVDRMTLTMPVAQLCRLYLAVLICVLSGAVVSHAQDPLSFFVEVEPARSTFFTGDSLTVNVFSNRGQLVNPVQVEILAGDRVVRSDGLFVQMPGGEIRRQMPHFRSSLGLVVDEKLPPGTYRARARHGTMISEPSAPFTVEPWGTPNEGIQASLTAPASMAIGDSLVVTVSLRNTSDRPLYVPSGTTEECAMPWLSFGVFDGEAATSRGLRDDRKDCGRPPTVLLQPGEVTTYYVNLRRLNEPGFDPGQPFAPGPGRLRVGVLVRGANYTVDGERAELWKGKAVSNQVSLTVQ
jgi:hypothetical protein